MKILLFTLPLTLEDRYGKKLKLAAPSLPNLGLAYMAATLREKNHDVEILDTSVLNMSVQDIRRYLSRKKYDLIGTSLYTIMYNRFKETLEQIGPLIKDKNIPLIVGGPHPSIFPRETLNENPEISYIIIGEGENTIVELTDAIEGSKDPKKVKGIAYKKKNKIIVTPPRPLIKNIDDLPFPARDLLSMDKYEPAPTTYRRTPLLHMITTRGCPFNCIYCSKAIFGKIYRFHSPERIVEEMKYLIKKYNAREIFFLDDLFTLNKQWANDVCNKIKGEGLNKKVVWSCSSRVNNVDRALLQNMKEAGCWQIHFGVESGSQRLLDYIKKDITLDQCRTAIRLCKEVGIQTRAYFMIGLPTETKEECEKTIEFAKELDPDYVKFSLTTPYPGTELYEIAKKDGSLKSKDWTTYKSMGGFTEDKRPYVPKGRTEEDLKYYHKKAFKDFYLRPRIILRELSRIRTKSEIIMNIRGALALIRS